MFSTTGRRRAALALFMAIFAVWAVVAVGLARSLQNRSAQPPLDPQVPVVLSTRDVAAHTRLTTDDVRLTTIASSARHPAAATNFEEVLNQVITRRLFAGELVLLSTLASLDDGSDLALRVPPSMRAIAVSFSEAIGAGGLITPGDSVDVIAVFDERVRGVHEAGYVLTNVRVLAVAQTLEGGEPASPDPANRRADTVARTVTLAVQPGEAERLALAERFGSVKIVLRAPGDALQPVVMPITADDVFLHDAAPARPPDAPVAARDTGELPDDG